jgi:4-amino-4-deoxy-L-arabinose transferase-like glycosyltransferase
LTHHLIAERMVKVIENPVQPETESYKSMGRLGWSMLFVLMIFAFSMRFYRLDEMPPGLHYDEAFNGLDAYHLLDTPIRDWPLFFTGNFGREPLLLWLMAPVHALFGPSTWTIRFLPALWGALLTPALAWLAWEAAPWLGVRNRRAFALWSGAAILALLWSQIFSRYGIRLSFFVLLQTLMWASLWRGMRGGDEATTDVRRQTSDDGRQTSDDGRQIRDTEHGTHNSQFTIRNSLWWSLAGLFAGLSFYTYLPARLLPVILLPVMGVALWQRRAEVMGQWRGMGVGVIVALVVVAPLGIYFIQNPLSFTTRVEQVSVVDREDDTLLDNLQRTAAMFAWRGDANPRSNVPERPALDLLLAPFFLAGLALALWRFWDLGRIWFLSGLIVMLLPTILSEFAPSFQRAIGALPFVALATALGLEGGVRLGNRLWPRGHALYFALASALLVVSIVLTWRAYFVTWANSSALFPAWDVGFTQLAGEIAAHNGEMRVYISPRGDEHPTVLYLLKQHPHVTPPEGFDGRICARVATDRPVLYYFLDNEDFRGEALLTAYYPDASTAEAIVDPAGVSWATRLEQPQGGAVIFPEMIAHEEGLGNSINFLGYWLYPEDGIRPGEQLYTRLFWQVTEQPSTGYTAFVHLVHRDENGNSTQGAGADRPPGKGSCPTNEWLPGEVVVDELQFTVPAELSDAGEYYLEVGLYTPSEGRRLDIAGSAEDRILLGPLNKYRLGD